MRVIEDGAGQHLENGMHGYFLTLTAPGTNDHLRWYQGKRPARRETCECHRHGLTSGQWNRQESACWNRVRTALSRDRVMVFAGAVETQQRGLLHRHVVLLTEDPLTYAEAQDAAIRAGYGCVVDVEPLQNATKAGRYLAKYVTKSTAERADVPWTVVQVDHDTGEILERPARATFRLWSSAHRWGVTMKAVKAAAAVQARARARYLHELQDALAEESRQLMPASALREGSPAPP